MLNARCLLMTGLLALLLASPGTAQTYTWINPNGTSALPGQWTSVTNWDVPPVYGPDAIVQFGSLNTQPASGYTTIFDAGAMNILGMTFNLNGTPFSTYATAPSLALTVTLASGPFDALTVNGFLTQNGSGTVLLQPNGNLGTLGLGATTPVQVRGTGIGELRISAPIVGGSATSGLLVDFDPSAVRPFATGASLVLTGNNTFQGDVVLNTGNLALGYLDAATACAPLGVSTNRLIINPGQNSVRFIPPATATSANSFGAAAVTIANPVVLNGTMYVTSSNTQAVNFTGTISGSAGILVNNYFALGGTNFPAQLSIQSPATFTGPLVISPAAGQSSNFAVSSNIATLTDGTLATTNIQLYANGGLLVDNTNAGVSNRLAAGTVITSSRGNVILVGRAAVSVSESIAGLVTAGNTLVSLTPTATSATSFTFGTLTRSQRGTLEFRGNGLGGTVGANNTANVIIMANPGGQTPGSATVDSQDLAVLPYAFGNSTSGNPVSVSSVYNLVRWDAGTGKVVPLNQTTEYASAAAYAWPTTGGLNYRIATASGVTSGGAVATAATTSVNGLVLDTSFAASGPIIGASLGGSGVLQLTGPILQSSTGTSFPSSSGYIPSLIANGGIAFGSTTGYIYSTRNTGDNLIIASPISGSGGIVKSGSAVVSTAFTAPSTFTGGLTINAGSVQFDNDANLGAAGEGITLNAGTFEGLIYGTIPLYSAALPAMATISRPLTLGPAGGAISSFARNTQLTYAGPISGNGMLGIASGGIVTLSNPANSFTGDISLSTGGQLVVTSDAALGNLNNRVVITGNGVFRPAPGYSATDRDFQVIQYIAGIGFPANPSVFLTTGNDFTLNGCLTGGLYNTAGTNFAIDHFAKVGTGTLTMTAVNTITGSVQIGDTSNTAPRAPGLTTALGGTIRLSGANGSLPLANAFNINEGASLILDNSTAVISRVSTAPISLISGSLTLIGNSTANTTQLAGDFTSVGLGNGTFVCSGLGTITLQQPVSSGSGQVTTLTTTGISSIINVGPTGSPVNVNTIAASAILFVRGTNFTATTGDRTRFLVNRAMPNSSGIIPGLVVGSTATSDPTDFAISTVVGSQFRVQPLTTYGSLSSTPDATTVADQSGSVFTLTGPTSLNALRIGAGGGVDLGGSTLKMGGAVLNDQAGMILAAGGINAGIVNGTLDFDNQPARIITPSDLSIGTAAQPVAINQNVNPNAFQRSLVKGGSGTLTLYGTVATNVGVQGIYISQGTLVLGNQNAVATSALGSGTAAVSNAVAFTTVSAGATLNINNQMLVMNGLTGGGSIALGNGTIFIVQNSQLAGSISGSATSGLTLGYPWSLAPGNTLGSGQITQLNGDNSGFAGQVSILNGILRVTTDTALGNGTAPVLLGDTAGVASATLQIADTVSAFTRNITVQAGSVGLAAINSSGGNSINLAGTLTLNKNLVLGGGSTTGLNGGIQTVSGQITGPGALLLYPGINSSSTGTGNYAIMNATNNYTGGTFLNAGQSSSSSGTLYGTIGVGADTVFSTGPVYVGSFAGFIKAENGPRTIANPMLLFQTTSAAVGGLANITWGSSGVNNIVFSGPITPFSSTGAIGMVLTLNSISRGQTTFNGPITNGGLPTLGLIKNGPSAVTLNGANNFSGTTTLNAGTLKIGNPSALGHGGRIAALNVNGSTTVASGAVLDLNGQQGVVEIFNLAGGSLVNSNAANRAIISGGNVSSLTMTAAGATVSAIPTISLSGGGGTGATAAVSLGLTAASFTVTNGGARYDLRATSTASSIPTLTITGADGTLANATPRYGLTSQSFLITNPGAGYTDGTYPITFSTPTGGTAATGNFTVTGGSVTAITVLTPGTGYTTVPTPSLTGAGTPTTSASITRVDGQAVVTGVSLTGTGADFTPAGTNGGTFTFSPNTPTGTPASGTINNSNFIVGIKVTNPGSGYTSAPTVTITGATTTATANLTAITLAANSNIGGDGDLQIGSTISGTGFGLNKIGTGTLFLNGANTYTGGTTLLGGIVALGNPGAIGTAGTISFGGGTLQFSAANTADYSTRFSTANGQLITLDTNGQNIVLASNLTSTGGSLTKLGAGTLTLTGANTYTGGTNINGGTLVLGSTGAIDTIGTISFGGGVLQFSAANTNDYSSRFNTASNQAYAFDTNSQNVTLASNLTSTGGTLTKVGTGTLTLTGTNTYTGGTNINGGLITLGSAGAIGTAGSISFGGGILQFSAANTTDYSGRFSTESNQAFSIDTNGQNVTFSSGISSVGGSLAKRGLGELTLNAASNYTGTTTVTAGTLTLNNSLTGPGGAIAIAANATLKAQGVIQRSVAAIANDRLTALTATGALAIGNPAGTFDFPGTLNIGANPVALVSNGSSFVKYTTISNGGTLGSSNGLVFRSLNAGVDATPGVILSGGIATVDGNVSLGQSGIDDARTYIQVADGATLRFTGVVKGNVTQLVSSGFNGQIVFEGLRKNGFSPGFSSYGTRDYSIGSSLFYLWGTTPAAPGTASSTPYYSNDNVSGTGNIGTLPGAGSANIIIRFSDETAGMQYTPAYNDVFTIIKAVNGATISNPNGMDASSLSFVEATLLNTLHLKPLVVVTPGVNGQVQIKMLDYFTWRNDDPDGVANGTVDDFNNGPNWLNQNVPTTNQVGIFDNNVVNYNGGNVRLTGNRNSGGLSFADSGSGGYTITPDGGSFALTMSNGGTAGTATINVLSAAHTINARLNLTSNLAVNANSASSTLTLNGVISGAGKTLAKSGPGSLVLNAVNTYTGATTITGGTLGGNGTIAGPVFVNAGRLRGGSGTGTGTLTVGATTIASGAGLFANLAAPGTNSRLDLGANSLNLATGSTLSLTGLTGFGADGSYTIASLTSTSGLQLDGVAQTNNFVFGTYIEGTGATGSVTFDLSNFTLPLTNGNQFQLIRSGNDLVLNFSATAIPEPAMLLTLVAGAIGLRIRRRRGA